MTVSIIGAGPSGCFLGHKLKWDDSVIFEKKSEIGKPVSCTGIVTESIYRVFDLPEEFILNHIDTFRLRTLNNKGIDISLEKKDLIIDREQFDKYISNLALESGSKIYYNHEFSGMKPQGNQIKLVFKNGRKFMTDYLVGSDGPCSQVAKKCGIYGNREILMGYQARVRIKKKKQRFTKNITDVIFGLGEFAWIVPENEEFARIGVIGKNSKNLKNDFQKLIRPYRFLEDQSGPIPMYNPRQVLQKDNVALIGDAATQVKPTTYGGIIYGMIAASYISEEWKGYEKKFRSKLGKDLWLSLKIRNVLNKLSENECEELIGIFEKNENRKILETTDRNFPSKFILQLLLKETKLWKYGFKLFK